jgi:hypothetical protein
MPVVPPLAKLPFRRVPDKDLVRLAKMFNGKVVSSRNETLGGEPVVKNCGGCEKMESHPPFMQCKACKVVACLEERIIVRGEAVVLYRTNGRR